MAGGLTGQSNAEIIRGQRTAGDRAIVDDDTVVGALGGGWIGDGKGRAVAR